MAANSTLGDLRFSVVHCFGKSKYLYPAFTVCMTLAALMPLLFCTVPPLEDYPAHLARVRIIHDLLTTKQFAVMYRLHPAVIPNLGIDAFVVPLTFLGIPVETAGRIFIGLVVLGLGLGVVQLHRTLFGRPSVLPLVAFSWIYNSIFMLGFVNYLAGIALLLFAFDTWLRLRDRSPALLTCVMTVWAAILFFCHLTAVVLLIGMIVSYEAANVVLATFRGGRATRAVLLRRGAALILPLTLIAILYQFAPLSEKTATDTLIAEALKSLGNMRARIWFLKHAFDGYEPVLDSVGAICVLAACALAAVAGRLRICLPMLPAIAGLIALYFIVPDSWAGTTYIPQRLPFAILLIALTSVDIVSLSRNWQVAFTTLVLALVLIRSASAITAWRAADRAYAPLLVALEHLPPGAKIYTALNYTQSVPLLSQLPFGHLAAMAAVRGDVFDAGVWALKSQDLVLRQPVYETIATLVPSDNQSGARAAPLPGHDMATPELLAGYDYLLAVNPDQYYRKLPDSLKAMVRSGPAVLYLIHHDGRPSDSASLR